MTLTIINVKIIIVLLILFARRRLIMSLESEIKSQYSQTVKFYSFVNNDRLFIGKSQNENELPKLAGRSVKVYTNSVSCFFMNLFGFAEKFEINNKMYLVNKKSFRLHYATMEAYDNSAPNFGGLSFK